MNIKPPSLSAMGSMTDRYAIVITTINRPTRAVKEIAAAIERLSANFVIVGDSKSPADFFQPGATYLDLDAQRRTRFQYADIAPVQHYARKNVGYLTAIENGATIIVETDDDNIPVADFWIARTPVHRAHVCEASRWLNVYEWFSDIHIWPRGFPLEHLDDPQIDFSSLHDEDIYCPIQQGLADKNPDVDAVYRLTMLLPVTFLARESIALRGAWCPFNSQNTTFFKPAFPLLYLPYYCSFRMTDIWRSFIAQRIAYLNDWGILFHGATVFQERNDHRLFTDFDDEVPGYLNNARIRSALESLTLPPGETLIPDAMRLCYQKLVELNLVGSNELTLLEAWLNDLAVSSTPPTG
jgi:STELLO glycosyltransferases